MNKEEDPHKQLVVCKAFTNVARCEEDVIFWLNYPEAGKVKQSLKMRSTTNIFKDKEHQVVDMDATMADYYRDKDCQRLAR